jgi:hypothetical protein
MAENKSLRTIKKCLRAVGISSFFLMAYSILKSNVYNSNKQFQSLKSTDIPWETPMDHGIQALL